MAEKLDPVNVRIGRNVREAREAANIGQAEMARLLKLKSGTQVWRYETGRAEIPTAKLSRIADAVGKSVADLIGESSGNGNSERLTSEVLGLAQLGIAAAQAGTPEAYERFNEAVLAHAARLRGKRPGR